MYNKKIGRRDVYTTGMVAKLCNVCMRTASVWIDKGDLVGHRLQVGHGPRRVYHKDLVAFLRANRLTRELALLGEDVREQVLLAGVDRVLAHRLQEALPEMLVLFVGDVFELGAILATTPTSAIVLDFRIGRPLAMDVGRRARPQPGLLFALAYEDEPSHEDYATAVFDAVLIQPVDVEQLAQVIRGSLSAPRPGATL